MSLISKSYNTDNKIVKYALDRSLREHVVLKELQAETQKHKRSLMMGAPEVLQLSSNLITAIGAKRVLDIGVFTGCSSLSAALALPASGEVHALDLNEDFVSIGKPFFAKAGVADKIKIHIAPAGDTLQRFIDEGQKGSFDFAFIDADKQNYHRYFEQCLVLLRKGGVIAVDNTIWSGKVIDESDQSADTVAIRAFNDAVASDDRVAISFLTIADGLSLLFVK